MAQDRAPEIFDASAGRGAERTNAADDVSMSTSLLFAREVYDEWCDQKSNKGAVDETGDKEAKTDHTAVNDDGLRKVDPKIDNPEKVRERYSKRLESLESDGEITADTRKRMTRDFDNDERERRHQR